MTERQTEPSRRGLLRGALAIAAAGTVGAAVAPGARARASDVQRAVGTGAARPRGAVIWRDGFATAPRGRLTQRAGNAMFGPTVAPTSRDTFQHGVIVNDGRDGPYLRQTIPAEELGPLICTPRLSPTTHAAVEYEIRFEDGFDWRYGGKMGPGLVGVRPGHDVYYPTSGRADRDVGFSARLMWHGRNDAGNRPFPSRLGPIPSGDPNQVVTYVYARHPCEGFDNYGWHAPLGPMHDGVWHRVRMEVKLNTVGRADGAFRVHINGVERFAAWDWDYRSSSDVKIQAILYDTHRGGGLDRHWTSRRAGCVNVRNIAVKDLS